MFKINYHIFKVCHDSRNYVKKVDTIIDYGVLESDTVNNLLARIDLFARRVNSPSFYLGRELEFGDSWIEFGNCISEVKEESDFCYEKTESFENRKSELLESPNHNDKIKGE